MENREKHKGKAFFEKIKEKFTEDLDIPADISDGGCTIELRGRGEAYVGGCRRIEELTNEKIKLKMSDFDIIILGEELECPGFAAGRIAISGKITSVTYETRRY